MAMLITAFIIALIIYFGVYYEKDKKIIEQRGKSNPRKSDEDFIIFPFLEENRNGSPKDGPDSSGVADHIHEDRFEE
jgi:hypothetical protein